LKNSSDAPWAKIMQIPSDSFIRNLRTI